AIAYPGRDRGALHVLHHQVRATGVVDAAVDQAGNAGMLETREDLALAAEALQQAWRRPRHLLDRRALHESRVVAFSQPDVAHSAGAERADGAPDPEPLRHLRRAGQDIVDQAAAILEHPRGT